MDTLSQEQKEEYWQDMSTYSAMFGITTTRESANNLLELISSWETKIFG
jgi:hypothetical protein